MSTSLWDLFNGLTPAGRRACERALTELNGAEVGAGPIRQEEVDFVRECLYRLARGRGLPGRVSHRRRWQRDQQRGRHAA